ncbi:hypothetical protein F8M41_000990 [Gigaspora margarita]|uniref:Uncharacterized protein n=1 Tax=Gigaspora margarita TaxID=4874 RepID=A0A8H4AZ61_GIGMA|nr:hypothetical protein F8M41_000990 [Gigaspora margarita]
MVDITPGNNINSRDDQPILSHSKLMESPIQEQNLSAPKNYDCVVTGECGPCDKLDSAALEYFKRLDRAKYFEFQFVSAFIAFYIVLF